MARRSKPLDLRTVPGWDGWRITPFGRAREWRLESPDGTPYTPAEAAAIRRLQHELSTAQMRIQKLERALTPGAVAFSPADAEALERLVGILDRRVELAPAARATPAERKAGKAIVRQFPSRSRRKK